MEPTVDEDRLNSKVALERRMIEEVNVSGFSHVDQHVTFYTQVAALVRSHHKVLDFGAGRGEWFEDDPVRYRRELQNLRGRVATVYGCDVDPAVLNNPTLDSADIIHPGEDLPYLDGQFDIVVTRYVFEHIADPEKAAYELARVVKPGGWLCIMTPNKWGYVALMSRLVPNRWHAKVLGIIQPHRKKEDVFPTHYLLNTPGSMRKHFEKKFDIYFYRDSAVPSYHFGRPTIFRLLQIAHSILPSFLATGLFAFMQRRAD